MSLTTDRNDPGISKIKENGQKESYVILSDEERAKGFVRPVRQSYVHVGRLYDKGIRMLEKPEVINGKTYVAIANVLMNDDGTPKGGSYITRDELEQHQKTGGYIGGCGTLTTMALPLAETYARDPNFYSGTFCCGCNAHLGVGEFVWAGTNEAVGS